MYKTRTITHIFLVLTLFYSATSDVGFNFDGFNEANIKDVRLSLNAEFQDNFVRLTSESATQKDQLGIMWYSAQKFHIAEFNIIFEMRMGNNSPTAQGNRDGIAFVIQNAKMDAAGPSGLGTLGYGDATESGTAGIPYSVAIEFDTYKDDNLYDPNSNHMSCHSYGSLPNSALENATLGFNADIPVMINTTSKIEIEYKNQSLKVFFFSAPSKNLIIPDINLNELLGFDTPGSDGTAWLGFTSSTSDFGENHDILSWNFTYFGNPLPTNTYAYGYELNNLVAGDGGFFIQLVDQYDYNITYDDANFTITFTGSGATNYTVTYIEKGYYNVQYTATIAGTYSIEILLDSEPIKESPWELLVKPGAVVANTSVASGSGLTGGTAGQSKSIEIVAKDIFGNVVADSVDAVFELKWLDSSEQPITAVSQGEGKYFLEYTLTTARSYQFGIVFGGQDIVGGPWNVSVGPAGVNAANCEAAGEGLNGGDVDHSHWFLIWVRDEYNNNITNGISAPITVELVSVEPSNPEAQYTIQGTVEPVTIDGAIVYNATYNVTKAARYVLSVTIDDTGVKGSPWTVSLVAGNQVYPPNCVAWGSGLGGSVAGEEGEIYIQPRDYYDNNITQTNASFIVKLIGLEKNVVIDGVVEDEDENGFFRITYVATVAQSYNVSITVDEEAIDKANGPFVSTILPAEIYPMNCFAVGNGLQKTSLGDEQEFIVFGRDMYQNSIIVGGARVTVELVDHLEDRFVVGTIIDWKNGTYRCSYSLSDAGHYVLEVKVNEKNINASPFFVGVDDDDFPPQYIFLIVGAAVASLLVVGVIICAIWVVRIRKRKEYERLG